MVLIFRPPQYADFPKLLSRLQQLAARVDAPKQRSPSEWADAYRYLPVGSAEPGPWRSERTPYMSPISAACIDPKYRRVIAVMGSQMGKTAGLLNVIGYRLDDDPAPMIYLGPTRHHIDQVIEPKVMELLKNVPGLWAKVEQGKSMSKTHKRVGGFPLRLAWAGSATELASDTALLVFVDELDRMANLNEGQVFELAEARTSAYIDGKVVGISTPTRGTVEVVKHPTTGLLHWSVSEFIESPIWRLWQEGTRHEWAWPCPFCEQYFIPRFKHLWWPKGATPEVARLKAKLQCPSCQGFIDDSHKATLNAKGRFIAPGQTVNAAGDVIGEADTAGRDTISFWVSGICSFSPKKTFGFLAQKWLAAAKSGEPERMQGVLNTDFGELYRMAGEAPPAQAVLSRRQGYPQGQVPQGVNLLIAGVDVQQNRLVYVICGWGKDYESWLMDYGELWGETDKPMVWQRLGNLLLQPLCERSLSMMAIDSGYQTPMVYQFCRQHPSLTFATKGHASLDKPFYKAEMDVNAKGEHLRRGLSLWHFNTDQVKSWVHARIDWPVDQPGGWWLPEDISEDYCQQMVSEQRLVKPSGQVVWVKVKKDNHYFDAESLAYLAIRILSNGRPLVLEGQPILRQRRVRRILSPGIPELLDRNRSWW